MNALKHLWKWTSGAALTILTILGSGSRAKADIFGSDTAVLVKIAATTAEELIQLRQILGTSEDTLGLIRDINQGIRDAMQIAQTMNESLKPGVLSDLRSVESAMSEVERLYGLVPKTAEAAVQKTTDQTVAEAIQMHNEAFVYADKVDPEAERIKDYARAVSPQGAGRLTAQSLGVLINVMNQVLRTNAAMLKLQGEQLALANRREKLSSEQFKTQYESLSVGLSRLKGSYDLPSVSGGSY